MSEIHKKCCILMNINNKKETERKANAFAVASKLIQKIMHGPKNECSVSHN